jgi:hypothetical protein
MNSTTRKLWRPKLSSNMPSGIFPVNINKRKPFPNHHYTITPTSLYHILKFTWILVIMSRGFIYWWVRTNILHMIVYVWILWKTGTSFFMIVDVLEGFWRELLSKDWWLECRKFWTPSRQSRIIARQLNVRVVRRHRGRGQRHHLRCLSQ